MDSGQGRGVVGDAFVVDEAAVPVRLGPLPRRIGALALTVGSSAARERTYSGTLGTVTIRARPEGGHQGARVGDRPARRPFRFSARSRARASGS